MIRSQVLFNALFKVLELTLQKNKARDSRESRAKPGIAQRKKQLEGPKEGGGICSHQPIDLDFIMPRLFSIYILSDLTLDRENLLV